MMAMTALTAMMVMIAMMVAMTALVVMIVMMAAGTTIATMMPISSPTSFAVLSIGYHISTALALL